MNSPTKKPSVRFLPSVSCDALGEPRFVMPIPTAFEESDFSVRQLVRVESEFGGYEAPLRNFLDAHLEPGDVFIDAGAHWDLMSMSAATRWPGQVDVLAIEAHPVNEQILSRWVRFNGLSEVIETVGVACGAAEGEGRLSLDTSMSHSLYHRGGTSQGPSMAVPIRSIDGLLAERPELVGRPTILKIDVEGAEPEVIEGARQLIASGVVKAIVWEKGFNSAPAFPKRWNAFQQISHTLIGFGFENMRLIDGFLGGPLVPWLPTNELHNIYSVSSQIATNRHYSQQYLEQGTYDDLVTSLHNRLFEPDLHQQLTRCLTEFKGTEGGRWSCWNHVCEDGRERADVIASWLPTSGRVLDIGAGAMALREYVADDTQYVPVDLLPWAEDTYVMDLNGHFELPAGVFETAVLSNVLEYVHDVPELLASLRGRCNGLIVGYPTVEEGLDDMTLREARGYFNHYADGECRSMLREAGFEVVGEIRVGGSMFYQLEVVLAEGLAEAS